MIKNKVSEYFGVPMSTNTALYMDAMNKAGKITARSLLDLMTIIIDEIDELQNKEETVNILDWKAEKDKITIDDVSPILPRSKKK